MPPHENPHHARRWAILAVLGIAQLMVVLDATIVNIALPSAQHALGFSDDSRQWVVTAYALAFGSLLLLGGRLGDLFGRKRTFVAGLLGFAAASAVGGAAGSFGVLVAARAAQGVFGALLAPSALALLSTTFTEPHERGKAFGIFGAIAGSGAAVGLLLGGALTEWLSWRWCLYVNLLFAVPTAMAATRLFATHARHHRPRLDLLGTVTATAGLFWLVYGLAHSETHSWGDPVTLVMLGASAVLLAAFAAIEARVPNPLLPLRILRDRTRAGAYLALGLTYLALFAAFLFLTYFLQRTRGFSPVETGLAFLPLTVMVMGTAVAASAVLVRRVGPRPLLVVGMLLAAAAMAWLAQLTPESGYAGHVLPALVVMGVGFGSIVSPAIATATHGVAREDVGVASAMVSTMQQVGGSVGTAVLSSVFANAVSGRLDGHAPAPRLVAVATVHGYTVAFWVAAGVFAAGAVVVGATMRSVRAVEAAPEALAA